MSFAMQAAKLARLFQGANSELRLVIDANGDPQVAADKATFKNYIINGDMRIAQRGTTFALPTAYAYGSIDRWKFLQPTSAAGIANQVASGLQGFSHALKLGRNSGSSITNFISAIQALETSSSLPLQGKVVTFSFYAKAGANFSAAGNNLTFTVRSGTGTDQAANLLGSWTTEAYVINSSQAITTSWVRYKFSGTVPANTTQIGVTFSYTPTGTAGADDNVYITGVQLEEGPTATSFEFLPFGVQLSLCQRYYEKSFPYATAPAQNVGSGTGASCFSQVVGASTTMTSSTVYFKTSKRTDTLTPVTYNPSAANAQIRNTTALADCSSTAIGDVGATGFSLSCVTPAASSAGHPLLVHWSCDAEL